MIPFEELAAALEAYRRRQQMEADLNAGSNGEGNGVSAAPPENTNEIDLNAVEEVDDSN
jgi:hypothetical protein